MSNENGYELGWDGEIEHDSEFILLDEGDYNFRISHYERARHNGTANLPPCNKAIIHVLIEHEKGEKKIEHALFLHSKTEGFLCQFFKSIGQRQHGEKMKMDWNKVSGARGKCHVFVDSFTGKNDDAVKVNKIKYFIDPSDTKKGFKPGKF